MLSFARMTLRECFSLCFVLSLPECFEIELLKEFLQTQLSRFCELKKMMRLGCTKLDLKPNHSLSWQFLDPKSYLTAFPPSLSMTKPLTSILLPLPMGLSPGSKTVQPTKPLLQNLLFYSTVPTLNSTSANQVGTNIPNNSEY